MKTNTELLIGLRDPGNDRVWTDFYARYQPVLISFGRHLGLGDHDAQDAAHEALVAFATAYREGKYHRDKGRLRNWLLGIAANKVRDVRRTRRREEVVMPAGDQTAFLEQVPDDHTLSDIWDTQWQRAILETCIQQVSREVKPSSMRVFELTVLQKCPAERAAAQLGMSQEAVYRARARVLSRIRTLRDRLQEEF